MKLETFKQARFTVFVYTHVSSKNITDKDAHTQTQRLDPAAIYNIDARCILAPLQIILIKVCRHVYPIDPEFNLALSTRSCHN